MPACLFRRGGREFTDEASGGGGSRPFTPASTRFHSGSNQVRGSLPEDKGAVPTRLAPIVSCKRATLQTSPAPAPRRADHSE